MHGTFEQPKPDKPDPPPPLPKRELVYLTNRAPIAIIEAHWPDVSQGGVGDDYDIEYGYGWGINIRLRKHEPTRHSDGWLLYATYGYETPREEDYQCVRVGRLLDSRQVANDLWKHIIETGDELRERIVYKAHIKRVVNAVDMIFEHLDAQQVD